MKDKYYATAFNPSTKCDCDVHRRQCCVYPPPPEDGTRPLRLMVAGLECIDWTPQGLVLRGAGPSTRKLHLWLAERRTLQEDIIIAENWGGFDADYVVDELKDFYEAEASQA